MKKLITLSLIIIALFAGCKKDKGDPPILPPEESMIIDFSNFETQKKSAEFSTKGTENSTWEFAAIAAGTWKLIIVGTLIVPTTSFQMVIDQTPEYVSEKTWQWSYNATIANATYKARLTGQIMDSDVKWKMYITKDGTGGFTDFLWFEGTSAFDGKSGSWTLYQSNANPVAIINIDWEKTGTDLGKIKYTYVKTNDPFKDSYIEYGRTSNPLNAYFTMHYWNGDKFIDTFVEWSTTARNGRVKSSYYLDGQWHCFNANRVNVTCP